MNIFKIFFIYFSSQIFILCKKKINFKISIDNIISVEDAKVLRFMVYMHIKNWTKFVR
jgi:hypothetical protein